MPVPLPEFWRSDSGIELGVLSLNVVLSAVFRSTVFFLFFLGIVLLLFFFLINESAKLLSLSSLPGDDVILL